MNLFDNKVKHQIPIFLIIFVIAITIGYFSSILINNGPFVAFADNYLIDIVYISVIILCMYLTVYMISFKHGSKLFCIFVIALTLRLFVVFAMSFFGFLPYQLDSDWDIHAFNLLQDWNHGDFHLDVNASSNVKYYSIITAIIYYLFNPNPIYMQLFNVFLSILSVYLIYLIANFVWNKRIALLSAGIMALWPTIILFSSMQMRESVAIVLILSLVYFFLKWMRYKSVINLVLISLFLIGSALIRAQNGLLLTLLLSPFIIIMFWKNAHKYMKPLMVIGGLTLIGGATTILILSGNIRFLDFNYIATEMSYRTGGGSSYLDWMSYGNIIDIIIFSPIRLFYFLYTPFPWQVRDITELLAFFESLLLLFMTLYILKGFKYLWRYNEHKMEMAFLIFFCILGLTANGLIDSNVGTAIRHKTQFVYLFFILFSSTYCTKRIAHKNI